MQVSKKYESSYPTPSVKTGYKTDLKMLLKILINNYLKNNIHGILSIQIG